MTVPSQVGSLTNIKSSAGSGSQSITVPSGATLALVLTSFWHTSNPDYTTLTQNSIAFTKVIKNASNSYEESNIWYLKSPSSGTFSWAISTTEGATITVMFLQDTDPTTPITGSNYGQGNVTGTGTLATSSFSSSTNDFVVGVTCGWNVSSMDMGVSGQTEIYDGGTYNSAYQAVGTKAGVAGTTTMSVSRTDAGGGSADSICGVSIAGTTGAGRTTKNTDSNPLGVFTGISRRINNAFHFDPKRKFFIPDNMGKIMIPA